MAASTVPSLLERLNDRDAERRRDAVTAAATEKFPVPGKAVNLHAHTFFSFNGYGYSPSAFAYLAKHEGLLAAGIVDFDVLDGVDEFVEAAALFLIRACAGIETRVFVPEFADREINSPGEPGIAYHMGVGFVRSDARDAAFLARLKESAQRRNRDIVDRVNPYLAPVEIDFERDVLPLTPKGNATERHICEAYGRAAEARFPHDRDRAEFWAKKLGEELGRVEHVLRDGPGLQALIRAKTMKRGGMGYVQPDGPSFPKLDAFNAFVQGEGAIPTIAWLDGTSAGEADAEALLGFHVAHGALALNIIPDRNWNVANDAERARKERLFDEVIAAARDRHMPVFVGTEMNAHGQRFVDDFSAPAMARHAEMFVEGAYIAHGHTVLEWEEGMGYASAWAERHLRNLAERYEFYRKVGERLTPEKVNGIEGLGQCNTPGEILGRL